MITQTIAAVRTRLQNRDYVIRRASLSYAFSLMVTRLSSHIGILIDNIIVGQYLGSDELAVMGVVKPIIMLCSAFGCMMAIGAGYLLPYYLGKGDRARVNNAFTVLGLVELLFGALATVLLVFFPADLMRLLGQEGALAANAALYLRGLGYGMVPHFAGYFLPAVIVLDGSRDLTVKSSLSMVVSGTLLDLLALGVWHAGIYGVGYTTSISQTIGCLVAASHFLRKNNTYRLTRPREVFKTLAAGVRRGFTMSSIRLACVVQSAVLIGLVQPLGGIPALVALNVYQNVQNIVLCFLDGNDSAMGSLLQNFRGEEDKDAIVQALQNAVLLGIQMVVVLCLVLVLFAGVVARIFGVAGGLALSCTVTALRCYAVSLLILVFNMIFRVIHESQGNMLRSVFLALSELVFVGVPVAWLMAGRFGLGGVWYGFIVTQVLLLLLSALILKVQGGRFTKPETWLGLPKEWGATGHRLYLPTLTDTPAAAQSLQAQLQGFCAQCGTGAAQAAQLSTQVQAAAGQILAACRRHGAPANIDLLLVENDGQLTLRCRYCGSSFTPLSGANVTHRYSMEMNHLEIKL